MERLVVQMLFASSGLVFQRLEIHLADQVGKLQDK